MSGMTRSMPNISSSGNISPQSITTISSPYSNTYMFLPISPTPPSGMMRSGWSSMGAFFVLGMARRASAGRGRLAGCAEDGWRGVRGIVPAWSRRTAGRSARHVRSLAGVAATVGAAGSAPPSRRRRASRSAPGTPAMSATALGSIVPVRSAAAGWYIANARASSRPCRVDRADRAVRRRRSGARAGTSPSRTGQGSRSTPDRARPAGVAGTGAGRHLVRLRVAVAGRPAFDDVRDVDLLATPAERAEELDQQVAGSPTNGRPCASSSRPGPSPTNTTSVSGSPSPGTAFVRVSWRRHFVHTRTSAAMASSACWRSRSVTPWPRRRSRHGTGELRGRRPSGSSPLAQDLGELDGVRRGALAQVVGHDPEGQSAIVIDRHVAPNPTDEDLVAAGGIRGKRVLVLARVVLDDDAGDRGEQLARPFRGDRVASSRRGRPRNGSRRPGSAPPCTRCADPACPGSCGSR